MRLAVRQSFSAMRCLALLALGAHAKTPRLIAAQTVQIEAVIRAYLLSKPAINREAIHEFPPTEACEGSGALTFTGAVKVATRGFNAEAKAAAAAGKRNAVVLVADELRTVYKVAAAGARYGQIVDELEALLECRQ